MMRLTAATIIILGVLIFFFAGCGNTEPPPLIPQTNTCTPQVITRYIPMPRCVVPTTKNGPDEWRVDVNEMRQWVQMPKEEWDKALAERTSIYAQNSALEDCIMSAGMELYYADKEEWEAYDLGGIEWRR